jgi:hypothetical protein
LNPFPPFIPDFRLSHYKLPKSDDPILRIYLFLDFLEDPASWSSYIKVKTGKKTALSFETMTEINLRDGRVGLALLVVLSITQKGW